jgi:hypothetical protein
MVLGVGVDPDQVLIGSLPKRFLADALYLLYHDAIKAVIRKTD